jgi:flagellar biosynthesis/type III secretory pathway protein FliH
MMTSQNLRSAVAALPRFSVASLALALALSFMLAAAVGISAWTIQSGDTGASAADVAHARQVAYQQGYDAGQTAGVKKGKAAGSKAGYERGRKVGFGQGKMKGLKAGYEKGKTDGYQQGFAAGQASVPTNQGTKKKKHT